MCTFKLTPLLALTGVAALVACSAEEQPVELIRPVISIVVADASTFSESTLPGRAKAAQEANLAFEVAGRLIERNVAVGDRVELGQPLASLDPRDFEARLLAAQGAYKAAQADYQRAEELVAEEVLAVTIRDRREALRDVAEGELRRAEKALADTRLVAPFAGTVAATYVENFQNVLPKQRIIRLLDTTKIEIEVSVPESLIALVPLVRDIQVVFDSYPDRPLQGHVTEIGDEASAATRTYPVTVLIDQPADLSIKPGMAGKVTGRAELPKGEHEFGIEVPLSALLSPPDDPEKRSYVWIVDSGGSKVNRREVTIQQLTPRGANVLGLTAGERVVTVGVHHLREDQTITLLD